MGQMPETLVPYIQRLLRWLADPRREFASVAIGVVVLLAVQAARVDRFTESYPAFSEPGWDHHAYRAMAAGNPIDFHLAPFGWRPLGPALAKALPFDGETSFFAITFASLTVAGVATYFSLKSALGRQPALVGMTAFVSLAWAVKFPLQDFWLPDALAFAAVALCVLCIQRRWDWGFAACLLAGSAGKEAVLFVALLHYSLQARSLLDWPLAARSAALTAPAALLVLAIHVAIEARNGDLDYAATLSPTLQTFRTFLPAYDYVALFRDIGIDRLQDHRRDTLLAYTSGAWGVPLLVLGAIGVAAKPLLALRLAPLLVLAYVQLLFAMNIERLLVIAFPAAIWLVAEGVRTLARGLGIPPIALIPIPAGLFLLRLRDPAVIATGFEIETFVLIGGLMFAVFVSGRSGVRRGGAAADG